MTVKSVISGSQTVSNKLQKFEISGKKVSKRPDSQTDEKPDS